MNSSLNQTSNLTNSNCFNEMNLNTSPVNTNTNQQYGNNCLTNNVNMTMFGNFSNSNIYASSFNVNSSNYFNNNNNLNSSTMNYVDSNQQLLMQISPSYPKPQFYNDSN